MKNKILIVIFAVVCAVTCAAGFAACGANQNPTVISVTDISIDKTSITLDIGDVEKLTATVSPADANNKSVSWFSSNESVATVSDGYVTGVEAGTATVTAKSTDGGFTAVCTVTVNKKAPQTVAVDGVEIDKASITLEEGGTETLTATVKPSAATNKEVAWTTSDKNVATVNSGVVTAVGQGSADITVTTADGGFTAVCRVTVYNFEGELFGDDINQNFYNYAPTAMREGDNIMHVWYCSNWESGNVTDYIAYRKGVLNSSGKWEFSEKQKVLSPGDSGEWDSRHVCDPSVIKGEFNYGGQKYNYLMAYLGCVTNDSSKNEVGIAVAKNPEGPFIKVKSVNPIAKFYDSQDYIDSGAASNWVWGYGQPSLVSVDGEGQVLLFYTKGATVTATNVEEWNLSNLDSPQKIRHTQLVENGITMVNNARGCIHNADFAYDAVSNRLYCYEDDFYNYSTDDSNVVADTGALFYIELGDGGFDTIFSGGYTWNLVKRLTPEITGSKKNHNACIVTDEYGRINSSYSVSIVYTAGELASENSGWQGGGQWSFLHTYRLHGIIIKL